jgi:hypothetical protein
LHGSNKKNNKEMLMKATLLFAYPYGFWAQDKGWVFHPEKADLICETHSVQTSFKKTSKIQRLYVSECASFSAQEFCLFVLHILPDLERYIKDTSLCALDKMHTLAEKVNKSTPYQVLLDDTEKMAIVTPKKVTLPYEKAPLIPPQKKAWKHNSKKVK